MAEGSFAACIDLTSAVAAAVRRHEAFTELRAQLIEELERRYLEEMLAAHGGNVSRAAAASGLSRRHFQRIKARLGANVDPFEPNGE